jgi:hypothetical protein
MSDDDASLPPNAPTVNGQDVRPQTDGEEDASTLEAVCADLNRRVTAFLNKSPDPGSTSEDADLTRKVQVQIKTSTRIIEKALSDYG